MEKSKNLLIAHLLDTDTRLEYTIEVGKFIENLIGENKQLTTYCGIKMMIKTLEYKGEEGYVMQDENGKYYTEFSTFDGLMNDGMFDSIEEAEKNLKDWMIQSRKTTIEYTKRANASLTGMY